MVRSAYISLILLLILSCQSANGQGVQPTSAIPFRSGAAAPPSTNLVPIGEWRSVPASSRPGAIEPDMSALYNRADQILTKLATCSPGGS